MSNGDAIRRAAEERYASGQDIWENADRWNERKKAGIELFCRRTLNSIGDDVRVLNAGAGSHPYDWLPPQTVNLDRFSEQVERLPNAVVGELEKAHSPGYRCASDLRAAGMEQ